MKLGLWILILTLTAPAFALISDSGKMVIESHGFTIYEADAELLPVNPIADPLLCQRVAHHLESQQRVARQLKALIEKFKQNPSRVNQAELDEMTALQMRAQESYKFLAQPAPAMKVSWHLVDLTDVIVARLASEEILFWLDSYALIWQGNGLNFSMPEKTATIKVSPSDQTLSLILQSSLINFCNRDAVTLRFVLE